MPYIGQQPATSFHSLVKQDFSVSATTGYTLSQSVTSANDIALFINNVRQEPTFAYSASGTTLTLTAATASGDDMYCIYLGKAVGTVNPASGSVGLAQLSATGTKNNTTFLRGDNTFATASQSNVLEILSSPCNGTQVTVPSGTYTMADVTATQDLTTSFADVTGSSINYTPPSGTTRVLYKFYAQFAYDNDNYAGFNIKFLLDGAEVTDARRSYYGNYFLGGFAFEYTINCNASGANTAHGDITSWTSAKIMKLQAAEYNSQNEARFHRLQLWEGSDVATVVVPTLTITAIKDS